MQPPNAAGQSARAHPPRNCPLPHPHPFTARLWKLAAERFPHPAGTRYGPI